MHWMKFGKVDGDVFSVEQCFFFHMNISVLSNAWYASIMNMEQEVTDVGNFIPQDCMGIVAVGGSTNGDTAIFQFNEYLANNEGKNTCHNHQITSSLH